MSSWPITVDTNGAVALGSGVVCDGYRRHAKIRVQTHVHHDHMRRFESSKGVHDILMFRGTRDLLIADGSSDLAYRENVHVIDHGKPIETSVGTIRLLDSGHMLGAAQVEVTLPSGDRLGYSGDFAWPLDEVVQVDALVVDATFGSPSSVRTFTQGVAEAAFLELVISCLRRGPVLVKAHFGTLHRAACLLTGAVDAPLLVSRSVERQIRVYQDHGYPIEVLPISDETLATNRYVRILGYRDGGFPTRLPTGSSQLVLSGFRSSFPDPILTYREGVSYRVCLSDHADFEQTLAYIEATGAKRVLVDNTRGGNAVALAMEIRSRLGVAALYDIADDDPY